MIPFKYVCKKTIKTAILSLILLILMLYNIRFGILSTVFGPSDDGPLAEIQLVNVVIGIHAFGVNDFSHLIVQRWHVMD